MDTDRPTGARYKIRFSTDAEDHLGALTARQKATLLDSAERQLSHQPAAETHVRLHGERGHW